MSPISFCTQYLSQTVALFQPKYQYSHPEKYLFSFSKKILSWVKVSKKTSFLFLKTEALVTDFHGDLSATPRNIISCCSGVTHSSRCKYMFSGCFGTINALFYSRCYGFSAQPNRYTATYYSLMLSSDFVFKIK